MKLNLIVATTLLALATQAAPQTAPTPVTDFNELQKEITNNNNSSSGGANLRLDADVTATANLTPVEKSLTLTGKEATKTLDGANKYAGFSVTGGNSKLTLKDLLLKDFKSSKGSAVTVNKGSVADITNVTFTGNSAMDTTGADGGGAIYNNYGSVAIANSTFTGNSAMGRGGAIYNVGFGPMSIKNSTFIGNSTKVRGGAIYSNSGGTTTIMDSTFTGNSAIDSGGVIFQNYGSVAIENATFTSNRAGVDGGAISNSSANYGTVSIQNSTFTGNSAEGKGGAIYNVAASAEITNTNFTGNSATGAGGAIYNTSARKKFLVKDANFTDNSAISGGAIYTYDGTAAEIYNVNLSGNKAVNGGAIFNAGQWSNTAITNSNLSGNSASGIGTYDGGGAIYNDRGTMAIANSTFTGNSAIKGGAICNIATEGVDRANMTIVDSAFTGNSATKRGGAIHLNDSRCTVSIQNSAFTDNSVKGEGGAIYNNYGGKVSIQGTNFSGNNANGADGKGGAIYNAYLGTANITDTSFTGNSATGAGGAIYNDGVTMNIVARGANVEFTGNTAAGKSNAIHNEGLVYFETYGAGKVIVNDAITGGVYGPQLNIDGDVIFNNDVSGNNLTVNSGALDFGDKGKFNDATRNVLLNNGSMLNLANGTTSEAIVAKDVSVANNGTANVVVDVDLKNTAVDSMSAKSSNQNGTFQFDSFRMLSDAADKTIQTVTVFTDIAKPKMGTAKTTFTSNYKYDVTATTNGTLTFTRGDEIDGVAGALTEALAGETTSLSLTGNYDAKANLTPLGMGGELTVFGQGHTFNGNGHDGFNVSGGTLNIGNATLSGFNGALTVGSNGSAAMTGVNFSGNTGAVANSGTLTLTDCSFTNNGTAGALSNSGILNIVASSQDVIFDGNSVRSTSNAIQCAAGSTLNLDALGHRQIRFDDGITGTGNMWINRNGSGTIVLNAAMDNYKGAVVLDAGTLQLGANGTFFNGASALTLNGGTLDFANGLVQQHTFNNLTLERGAEVKMHVDADLAKREMDTLSGTASSLSGKIDVTQIRLLSDAATETLSLSFANEDLKSAVKYSGSDVTYSPIFKYSAAYNEADGMFTFTRATGSGYKSFNPDVLASPIASQVGGYLTQLATYQQAFMGMERHMLLTSNLRANVSNSAPDTTKAQFDQNDLWIRPYTTYETVELDHGPNVDNVAWGTIVGFDSRLHDLGHEFDGGLSFYAGYNGSQQTYQSKDIVQHGGVLGMTGVLYRGNFFSGLTISGGASQAKADSDYGTDDFTILTAGIAAQTGYNWEVVKDRFIIQPGFSASYTFVKAYDYTSSSGVAIDSDPFHTVTLEPGLKFIGNLDHGWQPYCGVSMVWNLIGETETEANTIALPEMSIKPYVKGNVGVQKLFTDSLSGYLQLYGMGGGRDSIGVQLGFSGAF